MQEYQYSESLVEGQLRILVLSASKKQDEPLCGTLEVANLASKPQFQALSYSWGLDPDGDASLCCDMFLDGNQLRITQNLSDGLRRLRSRGHPSSTDGRRLWVDAICINQGDIPERNAQVRQMAEIYKKSASLVIWLGDCEDLEATQCKEIVECLANQHGYQEWSTHGISMADGVSLPICFLHPALQSSMIANGRPRAGHARARSPVQHDWVPPSIRAELTQEQIDSTGRAFLTSTIRLLKCRYFKRRWVIQEIFHSDQNLSRLYLGGIECDLETFTKACQQLSRFDNRVLKMVFHADAENDWILPWKDFGKIESLMKLKDEHHSEEPIAELCVYLQETTDAQCSDPRDRLFALLSMPDTPVLSPDYGQSLQSVCMEFSRLMVETGHIHELCTAAAHQAMEQASRVDSGLSIPSWCIDIRECLWFERKFHFKQHPPLPAQLEGEVLRCDVRLLGVMSNQYMYIHQPDRYERIVYATAADMTAIQTQRVGLIGPKGDSNSFASGDILCSMHDVETRGLVSHAIVLRVLRQSYEFQIIGTCLLGPRMVGGHIEDDVNIFSIKTPMRTVYLR